MTMQVCGPHPSVTLEPLVARGFVYMYHRGRGDLASYLPFIFIFILAFLVFIVRLGYPLLGLRVIPYSSAYLSSESILFYEELDVIILTLLYLNTVAIEMCCRLQNTIIGISQEATIFVHTCNNNAIK